MNSRTATIRSLLTPDQLKQLGLVKGALQEDPTCLDRKGHEKRIQGIPGITQGSTEDSPDEHQ
jgi:hypothetical protein